MVDTFIERKIVHMHKQAMDKQAGKQTDLPPFRFNRILVVSLGAIDFSCVTT